MNLKRNKLTSKKDQAKPTQFVRFLITGTVATAVLYLFYYIFMLVMPVNWAYTLAFIISFVTNLMMTTYFTFRSVLTWKKTLGFGMQQGVNYLMQIGALNFFLALGLSKALAPLPVFVLILPLNFILLKLVYRKKQE